MSRPMSSSVLVASAALAAVLAASPAAARDSWGKPNVGFAEYRLDSDECSNAAFNTKLWMEPIYHVIRAGYQYTMDVYNYARAGYIVQHAVTRNVADQLQDAVDRCLIDRGYSRFGLTQAQERQLSRFRRGTTERARYLHSLASDTAVMRTQALTTKRPPDEPAVEGKPPRIEPPIIIAPRPI